MLTRLALSQEDFNNWGWRVPFWMSILLVSVSYFIRKKMGESPLFESLKAEGSVSKNPLKEFRASSCLRFHISGELEVKKKIKE